MANEVFFKKIQQTQVQFLCSKMDYSKNPRGIILSSPTLVGQLEKNHEKILSFQIIPCILL
jgi:hypothetical protein